MDLIIKKIIDKKEKEIISKEVLTTFLNGLVYLKVQKSILKIHKINRFWLAM